MNIKVKTKCPICSNPVQLVSFVIKAGDFSNLTFQCRNCKIIFHAHALAYRITKGAVEFTNITECEEIIWTEKGFNPSER